MNTPKHTPGPWTVLNSHKVGFHNVVNLEESESGELTKTTFICETGASTESFANARLIAAAPELLEACKIALAYIDEEPDDGQENEDRDQIRAAIAKATKGENQ